MIREQPIGGHLTPGGPTRLDDLLDATTDAITNGRNPTVADPTRSYGRNCMAEDRCPDMARCQLCPGSPTYWRNQQSADDTPCLTDARGACYRASHYGTNRQIADATAELETWRRNLGTRIGSTAVGPPRERLNEERNYLGRLIRDLRDRDLIAPGYVHCHVGSVPEEACTWAAIIDRFDRGEELARALRDRP